MVHKRNDTVVFCGTCELMLINLFTDTTSILNSIVSNSYYGIPGGAGGQISMYLPPEHPIIDI